MSIKDFSFYSCSNSLLDACFFFVNGASDEKKNHFSSFLMPFSALLFFSFFFSYFFVLSALAHRNDEFVSKIRCRLNDFMQSIVPSSISEIKIQKKESLFSSFSSAKLERDFLSVWVAFMVFSCSFFTR